MREPAFMIMKKRLESMGRHDLADLIVKQYEDLSFFSGYDIQSFDESGNKRFIGFKSTKGKIKVTLKLAKTKSKRQKNMEILTIFIKLQTHLLIADFKCLNDCHTV